MEDKSVCKICHASTLKKFISFGKMPVANAYVQKEDLTGAEYFYDMEVGFCESCTMVQMINVVPYDKYIIPDKSGKTQYAFFSSTSNVMQEHFAAVAQELKERFLKNNDNVLEIGSNDGIFLQHFTENGLGIEPSENVSEVARAKGLNVINEFFSEALAEKIVRNYGNFKTIFSSNVILNIIDIHDLVRGVKKLLTQNGVFVIEDPYILDILEHNAYDQIYDEHVWYFSLHSLSHLFGMHDLQIFDAQREAVHGGSMRVYVCKKGMYEPTPQLQKYLAEEKTKKVDSLEVYESFARRVEKNKEELVSLLSDLKKKGKRIVGYAAASKGSIIQNYCNVGPSVIDYISDSTPFKQGLFTPGKHISIVSPDYFHKDNPDYAFIFAWNHAKEIIEKEKEFIARGGKFIVHLPYPHILNENDDVEKTHADTTQQTDLIEGVAIKKLKIFANEQGYLFETLRNDDPFFGGAFGQALVFEVYPGVLKGYHLHEKHDEYITCVKGNIKYIVVKEYPDGSKKINTFIIGERNPMLLKIPRGLWRGYMPLENKSAMIMDIMSKPYDPRDPDTQEKDVFAFGDVWTVKKG
ncbi:MAG: methyltransferase domain-containing protein [Nanoarchaeota archaeon]